MILIAHVERVGKNSIEIEINNIKEFKYRLDSGGVSRESFVDLYSL